LVVVEGPGKIPLVGLTPLEGVEVCETDITTNCATTDPTGNATLELPSGQNVSWTLVKDGYGSVLFPTFTGPNFDPEFTTMMVTDEWLTDAFRGLMSPYPLVDEGMVWLFEVPAFAGVTFDLQNATGKQYYADENGNLSLDFDATTSFGQGGFVEVLPGEFEVEIGGTAQRCFPNWAWPSDEDNRFTIPVREGYMTVAGARCPPP